jgi:hypothetical protein
MPIFHDPHESLSGRPLPRQMQRAGSPEAGFDRSLLDRSQPRDSTGLGSQLEMNQASSSQGLKPSVFDRKELIERIKRANSPSMQQQLVVSDAHFFEHVEGWLHFKV